MASKSWFDRNRFVQQWSKATPERKQAVRSYGLGWEWIEVPKWNPGNHENFPKSFKQKVQALCMAWKAPIESLGKAPAQLVELAVQAIIQERIGLR